MGILVAAIGQNGGQAPCEGGASYEGGAPNMGGSEGGAPYDTYEGASYRYPYEYRGGYVKVNGGGGASVIEASIGGGGALAVGSSLKRGASMECR